MAELEALIFDFDGVILESGDIKTCAFENLYAEYGSDIVASVVEHHLANGGISRRKKIRYCHRELLGIALSDDALEALCQRFSELVEDAVVSADWVPGAESVLERHALTTPMFVVSGTPHEELHRIVTRRDLGRYFVSVFGSPPEKPPILLSILSDHGFAAERALFIGDALTDCRAAETTGLPFVGRVADGRTNPFPPHIRVIRDLHEL